MDGSEQPTTLLTDDRPQFVDVSADGSHVAFNTVRNTREFKILDNVLSALK